MTQTYETLILDVRDQVAVVTINRPTVLNALNRQCLTELAHLFMQMEANQNLRSIVLTGSGEKSFVAGADIAELREMSPLQALQMSRLGHSVCDRIATFRTPVIAAVNGFALGGGLELALACDFIYASANAKFGLVETKLGLIPGFGGIARLSRRISSACAKEMMYSSSQIDADEALRLGLINRKITAGSAVDAAIETASRIAKLAPLAIASVKRVANGGAMVDLDTANALEQNAFGLIFSTKDHDEGIAAFLEKRSAVYKGE